MNVERLHNERKGKKPEGGNGLLTEALNLKRRREVCPLMRGLVT